MPPTLFLALLLSLSLRLQAQDTAILTQVWRELSGFSARPKLGSDSLSAEELNRLQAGDLILRRGYGPISESIVAFLQEPCPRSHVGVILGHASEGFQVLHSISDERGQGLRIESLSLFCRHSQAGSLAVYRFKAEAEQREAFLNQALAYLLLNPPFDPAFDLESPEKLYCTELIWRAWMNLKGEDCLPEKKILGDKAFLPLAGFDNPAFFEPIIRHCQP